MKKNIIALAVASAIAAPVAMADAPTIYGQVNKSIDSVDRKDSAGNSVDGDGVEVASRSSRLGVKGSEDLGNGLTAVYKLEFGVSVGDGDAISNRNQYVGLAGGFGTILAGRHDTPTKISQPTDFFNWGYGDLRQSSVTVASSLKGGEIRIDNVIAYISPAFNGVTLAAAVIPSEGDKRKEGTTTAPVKDSGLADTYSAALMYGSKKDGLYLAAAMDSYGQQNYTVHDGSTTANISATYTRLSAQYTTGDLTVNALLGNTNIDDDDLGGNNVDSETMVFGAAYTMGKLTPKFKYSVSKYKDETEAEAALNIATKLDKKTQVAVGLDYALGKKTKAYVEYVDTKNATAGIDDTDAKALSVGLLHKF